jgi:hypothetical protein
MNLEQNFILADDMNKLICFEHVNEIICKIMVKLKYYNLRLISPHAPTEENYHVTKE